MNSETSSVEVALDAAAELGEGPLWDDHTGTLLWVDILRHEVHRYDPIDGSDHSCRLPDPVGAVVPRARGGLAVAFGMRFGLLDEDSGQVSELARVHKGDRMNDGACDPAGRFWAGTMTDAQTAAGSALYVLEPNAAVHEALSGVTLSNGLAWSPSGDLLYYADTPLQRVDVFDYDVASGQLSNRRTVVDLADADGRPDGLTTDADGNLWVAMARGRQVRCHRPDGRLEHVVSIPAPSVTSCAFGGPSLTELYVTTARWFATPEHLSEYPQAGAVFRVDGLGARGLPSHRFAG